MSSDMTSEEKLLKLIRKKDKEKSTPPSQNVALKETPKASTAIPSVEQQSDDESRVQDLLKILNRLLIIVCIFIGGYLISKVLFSSGNDDSSFSQRVKTKSRKVSESVDVVGAKPFSHYREELNRRNIFESPWENIKKTQSDKKTAPSELGRKLKLVGIVFDDNPQAIIEDTSSKETVFLREGGQIGGATVVEIQESKVILNHNDEIVELFP